MTWKQEFDNISYSPVYLEEEAHVYIHKNTHQRYVSVTTILSLIKNEFPHQVKTGIINQYNTFLKWMSKHGYTFEEDREFVLKCLNLYINYKQFSPRGYKNFTKSITSYKSVDEFLDVYTTLSENHIVDRLKNVYLNRDGSVMTEEQMQQFWFDITDAANIYGTMVHEIVEQYILLEQRFVHEYNIEDIISERFKKLKTFLDSMDYPYSTHVFKEYRIEGTIEEFKKHIIDSFNELNADLGRICVPERLMFNEEFQIAGTCDVFVDVDDKYFDIGDHKTNKDFTTSNKYGKFLKKPFEKYEECDLILYNLQLSIYALLYEIESGKKLRKMWISYYSRKTNKFQYIKLKYLKADAMKIIKLFQNYLGKKNVEYSESNILKDTPKKYHNHLIFLMEKQMKKHKAQGFYDGKSKDEIRSWFLEYIQKYVTQQNSIEIPK